MKNILLLLSLTTTLSFGSLIGGSSSSADSIESKQVKSISIIKHAADDALQTLIQKTTTAFNQMWHNPDGLTSTQVMQALKKDGCSAHLLFLGTKQFLNSADPGALTLSEPCAVTCNGDGSASIGVCSPE